MIVCASMPPVTARPIRRRLLAVLAACAMFCGAPQSTAVAAESSPATLLVLGDSISAEYGLQRDTGWVKLLDARLKARRYAYKIVNASISGETTSGGLSRVDELLGRVKPAVVIVELGGNDALRGLDLATTQKNLDAIVTRSQAAHAAVLIVGMQIPPNYGKAYADRFAAIFRNTAKAHRTALTPFFFAGFADRLDLFQADRIHPTADAQRRLLDNVWPDLEPLLKSR
ncbi:MAG: arylesterase [Burkholderiaceae bacterium]